MEAHGCREFPAESRRGRFVRVALEAAVLDCIVPRFGAQLAATAGLGQPVTRDMAGRAMTYLPARVHCDQTATRLRPTLTPRSPSSSITCAA